MENWQPLTQVARRYVPGRLSARAKLVLVHLRYWSQARKCRLGYREFGGLRPQPVLFVAGLPKSGTTWLENSLCSFPGYHPLLIPEVARHEFTTGGSEDYELPDDMFSRFKDMLVVCKMHVQGSAHNIRLLDEAGVHYVIMYRDLRDVAISHVHYVQRTPWHGEYPGYTRLSLEQGLLKFADERLPAFIDWIRSWRAGRDPEKSLMIRYEDMLEDPVAAMNQVAKHFQLDTSPAAIQRVVDLNRFERLSGGRSRVASDRGSFFRVGTQGQWKQQFTPNVVARYKRLLDDFLIELDYEPDDTWGLTSQTSAR